ncbi:hypothetical protein SR870_12330 [Rhodopseudomonas palustris]|uniref:hypothetical protein n=1 Tax=Rhodopseudomonas palustris TaxID=1076 RepID=UPI002ACE5788|nr:hypothetical protein [Rhodopseudomonas palustris]WQG97508.1 hypothetical protein SR870_12330 [Rhodopseudomonas palustris]
MQQAISGEFSTRRGAELAVEQLVQEYGIDRAAILVTARGEENSSGSKIAGADAESGHPGVEKHTEPELNGMIDVSIKCGASQESVVETALKKAGAQQITKS